MAYNHQVGPPPPRYVMLSDQNSINGQSNLRPPPGRRNLPRYQSGGPSGRSGGGCCCGCLCWFCVSLLLILLAAVAAAVYLAVILDPKPPSYTVSHLDVSSFDLRADELSLRVRLALAVRAENPNDAIGIAYGSGSRLAVVYRNVTLCSGSLPEFYQGHRNITVIRTEMDGEASLGSGVETALADSRENGAIPLDVFVRVPVTLRLVTVDLRQVVVNVNCHLVVDNLSPGKKIGIKSTKYKVNVEF